MGRIGANLGNMGSSNKARKHYKKDSRFVTDLYTFTYDDFDLDDDKEIVKEPRPNSEGTISSLRNTDSGTKEPEREDLVTRFDRVVRGDPDQAFQV